MAKQKWLRKQKYAKSFEVIRVRKWDDIKDFILDDGCYLLIRTYKKTKEIGVAICDYRHVILKEFRGKRCQDIYNGIFEYSSKHRKNWFKKLDHAAYLGKELKKAEMVLAAGKDYVQE